MLEDEDDGAPWEPPDYEDDEPVGSCDNCGTNVYADDCEDRWGYLCNQCAFMVYGRHWEPTDA